MVPNVRKMPVPGSGTVFARMALDGLVSDVHRSPVRFLTGRLIVSKANHSAKSERAAPDLDTPTDLPKTAADKISAALNVLLADAFALYLKTKNFHWHVSGRHFHDYHLMLDEQSDAIFATTDQLAERARKLGGTTVRSIGQVSLLSLMVCNFETCPIERKVLPPSLRTLSAS